MEHLPKGFLSVIGIAIVCGGFTLHFCGLAWALPNGMPGSTPPYAIDAVNVFSSCMITVGICLAVLGLHEIFHKDEK